MTRVLNVAYQSDDYYAPITGVSLTSLIANNMDIDEINVFLLADQVSSENINKLRTLCETRPGVSFEVVDTQPFLRRLRDELHVFPHRGTFTPYFKLMAVNQLNLPTGRVLFVDGDTIINQSLAAICDLDLEGCILGAVLDCVMNDYKSLIGMPPSDEYFNSGVLLVDQAKWRENQCEAAIVSHLENVRSGYFTVDQDILNLLFRDKTKVLDVTYNVNSGFYIYGIRESFKIYDLRPPYYYSIDQVNDACANPVLNHCMGAMTGRPWEQDNIHPQNALFDHYLRMSLWSDFVKVKVKRSAIFRAQRLLYRTLPRPIYANIHKIVLRRYLVNMNKLAQAGR